MRPRLKDLPAVTLNNMDDLEYNELKAQDEVDEETELRIEHLVEVDEYEDRFGPISYH